MIRTSKRSHVTVGFCLLLAAPHAALAATAVAAHKDGAGMVYHRVADKMPAPPKGKRAAASKDCDREYDNCDGKPCSRLCCTFHYNADPSTGLDAEDITMCGEWSVIDEWDRKKKN